MVLSLPAIVGTGFFLAGALVSELQMFDEAPPISWGEASAFERLRNAAVFAAFLTCYFGAAFGPFLLPLAGQQAFALTRTVGVRSNTAIRAWAFVALGFLATALFWGWLAHLDLFI